MKPTKHVFALIAAVSVSALLLSCGSTASLDDSSAKQTETPAPEKEKEPVKPSAGTLGSSGSIKSVLPPVPAKLTEAPKFDFTGDKLQIELEGMYYDGFDLVGDVSASGSYALKLLGDSSWAIAEVNFPAGSYEAVANVLAPDSSHSRFNLYINKDTYLLYGSEPPIGKYELTTRAPASFTLDAPTTVTVKIQQNDLRNPANNGHNGMTIDYISFKKIN